MKGNVRMEEKDAVTRDPSTSVETLKQLKRIVPASATRMGNIPELIHVGHDGVSALL